VFFIGKQKIENRVCAAPMAGVSDKAYRILARDFGCGLVCSEMVSDKGLVYGQGRTSKIADSSGEERPVAVQIFGSEAESMAVAARIAEEMGADIIDINMGCPTPKIVKNGEGAALMLDIAKSRAIVREVLRVVKVPVSVKMRKGWDENSINCLELAQALEEEGVAAVCLHPRSRQQFFSGLADWNLIKEMKKELKIPVIGNGDIWSADDARRMIDFTGCDAVMIGRAALGNPFIFRETLELLEYNRRLPPPSREEKLQTATRHLDLVCQFKSEAVAVREMRKHFAWYIKGLPGATRVRQEINHAASRDELLFALNSLL
jgi:nifR3 family TIM-barrel protein